MSTHNPDRYLDALENIDTTHPDEWEKWEKKINSNATLGEMHDTIKDFVDKGSK